MTAVSAAQLRAMARTHRKYQEAEGFRVVRRNGVALGWTFHTGNYPLCSFGWITPQGEVGAPKHEVRLMARKELVQSTHG